jgi:hypothetical protein
VTEKLLETLILPTLPVYYGSPTVPNITRTKSFIRASDFKNPRLLANYLLNLERQPGEYNKYHEWRNQRNPFDSHYHSILQNKVAGPIEMQLQHTNLDEARSNEELNYQFAQRKAQCCRLCDHTEVLKAKASRGRFVGEAWSLDRINHFFFDGHIYE